LALGSASLATTAAATGGGVLAIVAVGVLRDVTAGRPDLPLAAAALAPSAPTAPPTPSACRRLALTVGGITTLVTGRGGRSRRRHGVADLRLAPRRRWDVTSGLGRRGGTARAGGISGSGACGGGGWCGRGGGRFGRAARSGVLAVRVRRVGHRGVPLS
jgi:hypothetical protein